MPNRIYLADAVNNWIHGRVIGGNRPALAVSGERQSVEADDGEWKRPPIDASFPRIPIPFCIARTLLLYRLVNRGKMENITG
ncbi:hypothetical protein, partial [Sphingomonas sanguinis]|uniref:hypothetical protein n=1 Tax=Sphingomonas sanguinis TaxID=33051 RepID=UPI0019D389AC